ncbi:hypothetical protein Plec18167_006591 [Paecilomyces lecythidis]|uniref:Uncharacterized protein n=1 Tax=Paecilomyces lecythidis TaxID=3004212 RepID=A0ABR3XB87_9EURO
MDGAFKYERTLWDLRDVEHLESSGFYSLPFHKFSGVVISLHAPGFMNKNDLFCRWRDITRLIPILKRTTIDSLTIRLQKSSFHDWFDDWRRPQKSSPYQVINCRNDYDVLSMPFFALRNLKDIRVEAQSWELRRVMDWKIINKGVETVLNQAWDYCESPIHKDYGLFGHDVDRAVAGDYFWLHLDMWKMYGSRELRRDFLSQWFDRNGNSEFETQIKRIMDRYPEIIETYDPEMDILEEMHMALVTLYARARFLHGDEDLSNWDQELWKTAFPAGIAKYDQKPAPNGSKRPDLIYLKHTKRYAYLSTMTDIIIDWRQQRANKPLWKCPSCQEYGFRRSYWS